MSERIDASDIPSLTLTGGGTAPSHKAPWIDAGDLAHTGKTTLRRLTARECARVQSYPDDYEFSGPPTSTYKQIGNSVPPLLIAPVVAAIKAALLGVDTGDMQVETVTSDDSFLSMFAE
jgi:site-specific DNA-cytosine methylase